MVLETRDTAWTKLTKTKLMRSLLGREESVRGEGEGRGGEGGEGGGGKHPSSVLLVKVRCGAGRGGQGSAGRGPSLPIHGWVWLPGHRLE
jgi:hypothetical protein